MPLPANRVETSVHELVRLLRQGEVTSRQLVDHSIARIRAVNPTLNAMVVDRFRQAAVEADEADQRRSSGEDLPLLGVPCTIKEFLAVKGLPQTGGLLRRKHTIATTDATVVSRLRGAGAIILGTTNVPEGGMWMETDNVVYGRTNNPWNVAHTPGGSSGGEAALIAAGASPFGIGSDIAGSLRIPAAFCGIASHKPSAGLVPNTGHWGAVGGTAAFLCCGPMARTIADIELVLSVIAGRDADDPFSRTMSLAPVPPLTDIVVHPVFALPGVRIRAVAAEQVHRAANALARRGARVAELPSKHWAHIKLIWARAMDEASRDAQSFAELLGDGEAISLLKELARIASGRGRHTFPAVGLAIVDRLLEHLPAWLEERVASAAQLANELADLLGPTGVILHPPYTRPAPRHHVALLTPMDFVCTAIFNITGMPATQVPTGFSMRGLPVGVQVASRAGNDRICLAVAKTLEEGFGPMAGRRPTL